MCRRPHTGELTERLSRRYTGRMLSCVLLAAGQSQRFGAVKSLATVEGQPVIRRLQETVLSADCEELIVVLGAHAEKIEPTLLNHSRVTVVHNKDHKFGQTSSFQCGLRQIDPAADGVLLLPVDYPFLHSATLLQLRAISERHPADIIIPVYQGRHGHPPVFPAALRDEFLGLDPGVGLNTVQHRHPDLCRDCPVDDPGVTATFNTPDELAALIARLT